MNVRFNISAILSVVVCAWVGALFADEPEVPASGKGTFKLRYEPKQCITTPCPQFAVLKFGKKKIEGVGADIDRKDFHKSAMAGFSTFFVEGSFERDPAHPEYIKIQVSKWYGIVKEDFSQGPSKR